MAATYRVDRAQLLVVMTWPAMAPDITVTRAAVTAMLADSRLQPGFGVLSDWRLATDAASSAYVRDFLDLLRAAEKRGITKWATVVASTAAYGAGRMAEIQSELVGLTYRVFRDYDEALRWLMPDR
jgi:hypothetical protein